MTKIHSAGAMLVLFFAGTVAGRAAVPATRAMGYLSLGLNGASAGEFQGRLDAAGPGYPAQPGSELAVGGGALFFARRLVLGLEGLLLSSAQRVGPAYTTTISGASGVIQVGFALVDSRSLALYPLVGFGAGAFTWKARQNSAPAGFDEVVLNPALGVSLLNASFLLQGGLGADYWLSFDRTGQGTGALVIGLRLGYSYSPYGRNWEVEMGQGSQELAGAPRFGMTGPFLRLVVGWGGTSRPHE